MTPRKKHPKESRSASLYREGAIVPRSDEFWKQVSLFILPQSDEGLLKKRIEACIPRGSSITCLYASDNATYFSTSQWQAKFVCVEASEERRAYEFWFSDPRNSTDITVLLQMNMLVTAIEKAFLLTDIYTIRQLRYATKRNRAFDIGMSSKRETGILDIAEWIEVTNPVFLSLKAIEIGSHSLQRAIDSSMVRELNKELSTARSELLVMRFIGAPALPPKIRQEAETLFASGIDDGKDQNQEAGHGETEDNASKPEGTPAESINADAINEAGPETAPIEPLDADQPKQLDDETPPGLCTSCGRQNRPGALFCVGCGKPLSASKTDGKEGRDE